MAQKFAYASFVCFVEVPAMDVNKKSSTLPVLPEAAARNEQIQEDSKLASLFDARPAEDLPQPSNLIQRAIAAMANAYRDAAQACQDAMSWMKNQLGLAEADPAITISKPRIASKKPLPKELQDANDDHRKQQAAMVAKQKFTTSADVPARESSAVLPEEGAEAFNAYLSLCKQSDAKPGELDCPQNFLDQAVKYAKNFVQNVSDRQAIARQENKEFWLNPDDQARLNAARHFLEVQVNHKQPDELEEAKPTQAHTHNQHKSFLEWRAWRADPAKLPMDPDFSTDAALAYAHMLLQTYAGKDLETVNKVKDLLNSAYDLIGHPESLVALDSQLIIALVEEDKRAIAVSPNVEVEPPSVIDSKENETVSPPGPPPPPPPSSRVNSAPSFLPPEWHIIPAFDSLDEELKVEGTVLLNRFFKEFSDQVDKGMPDFSKRPDLFFQVGASAAVDFLKRVLASSDYLATVQPKAYAAANYIINEHLRRRSSQRDPGA